MKVSFSAVGAAFVGRPNEIRNIQGPTSGLSLLNASVRSIHHYLSRSTEMVRSQAGTNGCIELRFKIPADDAMARLTLTCGLHSSSRRRCMQAVYRIASLLDCFRSFFSSSRADRISASFLSKLTSNAAIRDCWISTRSESSRTCRARDLDAPPRRAVSSCSISAFLYTSYRADSV